MLLHNIQVDITTRTICSLEDPIPQPVLHLAAMEARTVFWQHHFVIFIQWVVTSNLRDSQSAEFPVLVTWPTTRRDMEWILAVSIDMCSWINIVPNVIYLFTLIFTPWQILPWNKIWNNKNNRVREKVGMLFFRSYLLPKRRNQLGNLENKETKLRTQLGKLGQWNFKKRKRNRGKKRKRNPKL